MSEDLIKNSYNIQDIIKILPHRYPFVLIDRIDEVEEQIQPVDLTSVFADIADVREKIAMIQIPNIDGLKKDIKEITNTLLDIEKNIAIISKENEVQDLELEELKVKSNNPLAN